MIRGEELQKAKADADAWNKTYAVGQAVIVTKDNGETVEDATRAEAAVRGYQAVVWLKGVSGAWPLAQVKAKERTA